MEQVINSLLNEHLYRAAFIVVVCFAALIISMGVDLVFGIRKAKENGEATTSRGFKKTCEKARKYFSPFLVTVCVDVIACVVIEFPVFTMIWSAYCVFCEFVSVREKAWQKAEIRKQEKTMQVIVENRSDIVKMITEALATIQHKEEDTK